MKLLLYCTKAKPYLLRNIENKFSTIEQIKKDWLIDSNGKTAENNGLILAECDFEVEEIKRFTTIEKGTHYAWYEYKGLNVGNEDCELQNKSCLTFNELSDYLLDKSGYAIHIKNLRIFNKPRELYELKSPKMFNKFTEDLRQAYIDDAKISERITEGYADEHECANNVELTYDIEYVVYGLKKAPQNMMYVYDDVEKKVLISIRPEWLCKILNGEKTIEVRKKVLKGMLENAN